MCRSIAPLLALIACPALAEPLSPVTDRDSFLALVEGRTLSHVGVKLVVDATGQITGHAFGRPVTGEWTWQDRYFCRSMEWGDDPVPYNCQTVDRVGDRLRFKSDHGTGEEAKLRLN